MNSINKITLLQYRNYSAATYEFRAPVTCITGPNGSGKTNLLDAVYYLCYTKSYFSAYQQNSVQNGLDGFRVTGNFNRQGKEEAISCKWKAGKKEIYANDMEYEKVTDHIGVYSAVMIAPDDTELINGSSEPAATKILGSELAAQLYVRPQAAGFDVEFNVAATPELRPELNA